MFLFNSIWWLYEIDFCNSGWKWLFLSNSLERSFTVHNETLQKTLPRSGQRKCEILWPRICPCYDGPVCASLFKTFLINKIRPFLRSRPLIQTTVYTLGPACHISHIYGYRGNFMATGTKLISSKTLSTVDLMENSDYSYYRHRS